MTSLWRNWQFWLVIGFTALCLLVTYPYFESTRNANERPRLIQILSIVDGGELAIDGAASRRLRSGPDVSRNPETDRLFPNKPPGATFIALPAYWLAKGFGDEGGFTLKSLTFWARLITGWLPTIIILGLSWFFFGPRARIPLALALLLYGLGTPASSYANLFYGHQLAACCLFAGIGFMCRARRSGNLTAATIGGFAAGMALLVEYGAGFAGIPIGLFLLMGLPKPGGMRVMIAATCFAAMPIILLLAYHQEAFGSAFSTGYHHVINPDFAEKHGQGFLGLSYPTWTAFHAHILSANGGLLWWAPLFPVGLIGLGREIQDGEYREEAILFLSFILLMILVGSSLSFDGGWRVGPRYMVVALPGLILGWKRYFNDLEGGWKWGVVAALATWSITINGFTGHLFPHLDLTHIVYPWSDVIRPLLLANCRPDILFGSEEIMLWLLGSGAVLLLGIFLVKHEQCSLKSSTAGILSGLLFLTLLPPSDGKNRDKNLDYVVAQHTCGDTDERPRSFVIRPLKKAEETGR